MNNCAVNRDIKYGGHTCFTKNELVAMVQKYNTNNKNKININQNKTNLYKDFLRAISCTINTDICILDTLNINRDTILKPKQPDGAFAWISSIDIQKVMEQYEKKYPSFLFLGAVPIDFHTIYPQIGNLRINKTKQNKIGIIFNTDESYKSGQHWISLFIDKQNKTICFFDSTGDSPPKQVLTFINNIQIQDNYQVIINTKKHQMGNNACGIYSLFFIIERLKGKKCKSIFDKVIKDKMMNNNRKQYFSQN